MEKVNKKYILDDENVQVCFIEKNILHIHLLNLSIKAGVEIIEKMKSLDKSDIKSKGVLFTSGKKAEAKNKTDIAPLRRKILAGAVQDLLWQGQPEKIAIAMESAFLRMPFSFVLKASGIKNLRSFETKKEALKWLKESQNRF